MQSGFEPRLRTTTYKCFKVLEYGKVSFMLYSSV
jgi:hypothetical protein